MFDLGMQELIVIFIVALLVFGPKKLPELGRTIGKGVAELKKALHGVKEQIDAEMLEVKKPMSWEDHIIKPESQTEDLKPVKYNNDSDQSSEKTMEVEVRGTSRHDANVSSETAEEEKIADPSAGAEEREEKG
ncbi:MAG: twin-arginine translocase TatA/TatE family subunit [Thermodesulfovibrionales bacterium]|nr:twin-arginine translocase TatA/TatE family subunit [Thermodesulfovibrionales bacterium]